jgi:hypothetical protein
MFDSWMGYLDIGGEVLHDGANELCLVGGESRGFGVGHGDVSLVALILIWSIIV